MTRYNPTAPAIMRKDPSLGYAKDNVFIVCQVIADLAAETTDHPLGEVGLLALAGRVVELKETIADRRHIGGVSKNTGLTKATLRSYCELMARNKANDYSASIWVRAARQSG